LATIYRIWMLRYVDVPDDIGRALEKESGKKKHIPVVAMVNGRSTRTTLVPAGGGRYRLQFNATLRKAARADVGEVAGVGLKIDREPRDLPVPQELEAALKTRPRLKREFERLAPGGRMQFLRYLLKARAPATREKRVKRMLEILLERSLLRPCGRRAQRGK
jgi:bacteriocin resistance YdeI/OmpD-like protein/uncharacterized protein DUF1905